MYFSIEYPENSNIVWVFDKIEERGSCKLANTFLLTKNDILDYDKETYSYGEFIIAQLEQNGDEEYYKINKRILQISFDLYFEKSCDISKMYFLTARKTSIFKIIDEIGIDIPLVIGGNTDNAISEADYIKLLQSLPNGYEHSLYDKARVCTALKKFFCVEKDKETTFQKYVNSKNLSENDLSDIYFEDFDIQRYEFLLKKLKKMLKTENEYSEKDWQNEIIKFIKIIFPKYVLSEKEAIIKKNDYHNMKRIDIILGDYDGNIDIVEIKKPESAELLREYKNRDNYVPSVALQAAIMQAEKYIYYLSKDGIEAEENLNKQFSKKIPSCYEFKIRNPRAIIILGRSENFSEEQKEDFEIIKRKYKNIVDIISYDDLLNRLKTVVNLLKNQNFS
ncbi:Shedu immune nuclease family protein [Treponema sp. UBA3813]|uniref:Shedu immune nuclease family protein n=1 Tax=Treponema sp. UBA3813 TaxID=1947715 RepID=UPI0025E614DA|nr:Shedu immune nuclease family protein [Treponema sp. UBA3813]